MRKRLSLMSILLWAFSAPLWAQSTAEPFLVTPSTVTVTPGGTTPVDIDLTFVAPASPDLSTLYWQWVIDPDGSAPEYWNGTAWVTSAYWSPAQGEASGFFADVSVTGDVISGVFDPSDFPAAFFSNGERAFAVKLRHGPENKVSQEHRSLTIKLGAPQTPTGLTPSGVVSTAQPTLNWNAVTGADSYRVMISRQDGSLVNSAWETSVVNGTSLAFPESMNVGETYRVHVASYGVGGMSHFSATVDVVYQPPLPDTPVAGQMTPLGTLSDSRPTFTWTAVPGATSYYIGFLSSNGSWHEPAWRDNPVSGTSYQPAEKFENDYTYEVFLIAANGNGQSARVDMGEVSFFSIQSLGRAGVYGEYSYVYSIYENIFFLNAGSYESFMFITVDQPNMKIIDFYANIAAWQELTPNDVNLPDGGNWNGVSWQETQHFMPILDLKDAGIFTHAEVYATDATSTTLRLRFHPRVNNKPLYYADKFSHVTLSLATDDQGNQVKYAGTGRIANFQDVEHSVSDNLVFDVNQTTPTIRFEGSISGESALAGGGIDIASMKVLLYEERADGLYYWNFTSGLWTRGDAPRWQWLTSRVDDVTSARENVGEGVSVSYQANTTDMALEVSFGDDFAWANFLDGSLRRDFRVIFQMHSPLGGFNTEARDATFQSLPNFNASAAVEGLGSEPAPNSGLPRLVTLNDYNHGFTSNLEGYVPDSSQLPLNLVFVLFEENDGLTPTPSYVKTLAVDQMNRPFDLSDLFCQLEVGQRYYLAAYLSLEEGSFSSAQTCPSLLALPELLTDIPGNVDISFTVNGSTGHYLTALTANQIRNNGYVFDVVPPAPASLFVDDMVIFHPENPTTPVAFDAISGLINKYAANTGSSIEHEDKANYVSYLWQLRGFSAEPDLPTQGCTPNDGILLAESTDATFEFGLYDPTGNTFNEYILTYTAWNQYGQSSCLNIDFLTIRDFSAQNLLVDAEMFEDTSAPFPFTIGYLPRGSESCLKPDDRLTGRAMAVRTHPNGINHPGTSLEVVVQKADTRDGTIENTLEVMDPDDQNAVGLVTRYFPQGMVGCSTNDGDTPLDAPYPFGFTISSLTDELTGRVYSYQTGVSFPTPWDDRPVLDTVVRWDSSRPIIEDACDFCDPILDGETNVRTDPVQWKYGYNNGQAEITELPTNIEVRLFFDQAQFDAANDWKVQLNFRSNGYRTFNNNTPSISAVFGETQLDRGGVYTIDLTAFHTLAEWQSEMNAFCDPPGSSNPNNCIDLDDIVGSMDEVFGFFQIFRDGPGGQEQLTFDSAFRVEFDTSDPPLVHPYELDFNHNAIGDAAVIYDQDNPQTQTLDFPYIFNPSGSPPTINLILDEMDWLLYYDDPDLNERFYWVRRLPLQNTCDHIPEGQQGWCSEISELSAWVDIDSGPFFSSDLNTNANTFSATFTAADQLALLDGVGNRTIGVDMRYNRIPPGGSQTTAPRAITATSFTLAQDGLPPVSELGFGPAAVSDFTVYDGSQVSTTISYDVGEAIVPLDAFQWSWRDGDQYWTGSQWVTKPAGAWTSDSFVPVRADSGFFRFVTIGNNTIGLDLAGEDFTAAFFDGNNARTVTLHLAVDTDDDPNVTTLLESVDTVALTFNQLEVGQFVLTSPLDVRASGSTGIEPVKALELPADIKPFVYAPEPFVLATSNTVDGNLYYVLSDGSVDDLTVDQPVGTNLHQLVSGATLYTWLTVPFDGATQHPEIHAFIVPFNPNYIGVSQAPNEIENYDTRKAVTITWPTNDDTWTRSNDNVIYKKMDDNGKDRLYVVVFVDETELETSRVASALSLQDGLGQSNSTVNRNAVLDTLDDHNRMLTIHYVDAGIDGTLNSNVQAVFQVNFYDQLSRHKVAQTVAQFPASDAERNLVTISGGEVFDSLGRRTKLAKNYLEDMTNPSGAGVLGRLTSDRPQIFADADSFWSSRTPDNSGLLGESEAFLQTIYESKLGKARPIATIPEGSRLRAAGDLRYTRMHYFTVEAPTTPFTIYDLVPSATPGTSYLNAMLEVDPNGSIIATLYGADIKMPVMVINNPSKALMTTWGLNPIDNAAPSSFDDLDNKDVYLPAEYGVLSAANDGNTINQVTFYEYDQQGRMVSLWPPRSLSINSSTGALTQVTGEANLAGVNGFDNFDRIVTSQEADMTGPTHMFYDAEGLLRVSQGPLQRSADLWSVSVYDEYDRLIRIDEVYDANYDQSVTPGTLITASNTPNGAVIRSTTTRFDNYNVSEVSPFAGESAQIHRWPNINDLAAANPFENDFSFGHPLGSVTEIVGKNSAERNYVDGKGRVVCRVALLRGVTEPQIIWLDYNNKDRVVRTSYQNAAQAFGYSYDANERIVKVYDLDTLGARAVFEVTAARDVTGDTSQLLSATAALGPVLDEQSGAAALTNHQTGNENTRLLSASTYSPTGHRTSNSYADNKITESYLYDIRDLLLEQNTRVDNQDVYKHEIDYFGLNSDNTTAANGFNHSYAGNITWRRESYRNQVSGNATNINRYGYDLNYQLVNATTAWNDDVISSADTTNAYRYDANGNRIQETRTNPVRPAGTTSLAGVIDHNITQGTNKLDSTQQGVSIKDSLSYDAQGNVTQINRADGRVQTLKYLQAAGASSVFAQTMILPYQITQTGDGSTRVYDFDYDHMATRIRRSVTVNGGDPKVSYFLPSGTENLAELDASGRVKTAYTFSDDQRIGYKKKSAQAVYIKDHLGSTKMTVAVNRDQQQPVAAPASLLSGLPDGARGLTTEPTGPVMHLTFDGHLDDLAGDAAWTVNGNPTYDVSHMGQAMRFSSASDYLQLSNDVAWDESIGDLSVAYWVKLANSVNDDSVHDMILSNGDPNGGFDVFLLNSPSTPTYQRAYLRTWNPAGNAVTYTNSASTYVYDDQEWYHVAFTITQGEAFVYINGQLADRGTATAEFVDSALPMMIGKSPHSSGWLNGWLDDLKVWRRALTPTEVTAEYRINPTTLQGEALPAEVGLVYHFDLENTLNDSITGLTATQDNSARFLNGPSGRAYELDGTNEFELDLPAMTSALPSAWTYASWVRLDESTNPYRLFFFAGGQNGSMDMYIRESDGKISVRTDTNGTRTNITTEPSAYPMDGAWHHVAVTVDGSVASIYVDGNLTWQQSNFVGYTAQRDRVMFGDNPNKSMTWVGGVDDIRFYDRALAQEDILALFNPSDAVRPADAPTLAYTLDEHVYDSGSLASHGVYSGGTPAYTDGIKDKALLFDGVDDQVNLGPWANVAEDYNNFTFSTWARLDADLNAPTSNGYTLFGTWDEQGNGLAYWIISDTNPNGRGRVYASLYNGTLNNTNTVDLLHYPNDQQWHHIALTADNGEYRFYIDGVLRRVTSAHVPLFLGENIILGGQANGIRPWNGALDQSEFFNRTLTGEEILAQYIENAPASTISEGVDLMVTADGDLTDTVAGTTATVTGTVSYGSGVVGQSVEFTDNSAYLTYNTNLFNNAMTNGMSVAFWFRWDNTEDSPNNYYLMGNYGQSQGGFDIRISRYNGLHNIIASISDGTSNWGIGTDGFTPDGKWHHYALIVDGDGRAWTFLDGERVKYSIINTVGPAPHSLQIGASGLASNQHFQGGMDDIRIFAETIPFGEVARLYHAGLGDAIPNDTHWAFEGDTSDAREAHDLNPISAYQYQDGVQGRALALDGLDDCLEAQATSLALSNGDNFSFDTWIKLDADLSQNGLYTVASNKTASAGFNVTITGSTDPAAAGRITYSNHTQSLQGSVNLPNDNGWHHLAVIQTAGTASVFLDGVEVAGGNVSAPNTSTARFTLGADAGGGNHLPALLDETRFSTPAKSADEMLANFYTNAPETTRGNRGDGLVASWLFDGDLWDSVNIMGGDANGGNVSYTSSSNGEAVVIPDAVSITLGDEPDYQVAWTELSLNLWASVEETTGTHTLVKQGGEPTQGGIHLKLDADTNSLIFELHAFIGPTTITSPAGSWPADQQQHLITVTWSGSQVNMYVDGALIHSETTNTAIFAPQQDLQLGAAGTALTVDQLDLHNRVLNNWEIADAALDLTTVTAPAALPTRVAVTTIPYVLARSETDPYGIQRLESQGSLADLDDPETQLYTGQEKEDGLDLYYYGARWYAPEYGRFLQIDPEREFHAPYSYVGNSPINAIDPNGENIYLLIWKTENGDVGHASIAIQNYDSNGQFDGTYTIFGKWPGVEAGMKNFDEDLPAAFEHLDHSGPLEDYELPSETPKVADGIIEFFTASTDDIQLKQDLEARVKNKASETYNGVTDNCSTFACGVLNSQGFAISGEEELAPRRMKASRRLIMLPAVISITPNQLFKDAKKVKGVNVIKDPGALPDTMSGISNGRASKARSKLNN